MIKKQRPIVFFILSTCYLGYGQAIFSNSITGTNPNTSDPYTLGQIVDPNISVSGIGRGPTINGNNGNNRYNARDWNLAALDNGDYFYFTITPNSGFEIDFDNFEYTGQSSPTGPVSIAIRSSLDGFVADIGAPNITGSVIDLSSVTYQNITSPITFRVYAWGGSNTNGTFSINDFSFNGTISIACTSTSIWNGTWSNGSPNIHTAAIINGDYNTASNTSIIACSLIVNNGFTLTIADGDYVEAENDLTVNGNIIVQPQGSFIQNNDNGIVDGAVLSDKTKITVNKNTASPSNNWYEYTYWSSPVKNETIADGLFESATSRRFEFKAQNYLDQCAETNNNNICVFGFQDDIDDDGNDWQWVNGATVMQPGIGYASTHDAIIFGSTLGCPGPTCSIEYTFNGPFNNGEIIVPIYRNDLETNDTNLNLIGNPYPSAISVDDFFDLNAYDISLNPNGTLGGVIYLWSQNTLPSATANGNQKLNFSDLDYAIINAGTGEIAGGDGLIPKRFIPSGQGFFVEYSNSGATIAINGDIKTGQVIINNAMRVTGDNDQFFGVLNSKSTIPNSNKLWVNLTSDLGTFNQILVGFVDGATNSFDGMYYDVPRNLTTKTALALYSLTLNDKSKYAIQGKDPLSLNLDESIPLGFYTAINTATLYTLSMAQFEGDFFTANTVYLKDNLTHTVHNLKESDYTFTSEVGEFNDRFEIVFQTNALSISEAWLNSKNLTITELNDGRVRFKTNNYLAITSVKIMDIYGRTLYQHKGSSDSEIFELSNLDSSPYIARVALSNGQIVTKKFIKRR